MLLPLCLEYEFDRRLILTYCTKSFLYFLSTTLTVRGWYFLTEAAAAATAGQVNSKRKTQAGARQAVLPRACTYVPGASEDAGRGQGFLFHSRPQWIHLFREIPCKALSLEDRSQSCLHMPSNSFKHQQTCTQSAIEGKQAGSSLRGERIQPSVFLLHLMLLDQC